MPVAKIQFRPGINKETTSYANEGGFYDCDKIRFRSGNPEKIGGWINISPNNTYYGVARALHNWVTLSGANLLGVGTGQKYYIENGGHYYDVTPLRTAAITLGASPLATTSGSKLVTVTASAHGASVGTFVTITSSATVGGLDINGEYEILTTPDGNSFTIAAPTAASGTTTGGGTVTVTYQINAGSSTYTLTGGGWGTGPWGSGGWGEAVGTGVGIPLRLWTQCNYGENLILAPRGGAIYYWDVDTSSYTRAVTLSSMSESFVKTTTTATFTNGVTTITVGNAAGITAGAVITGTNIATGTYVTTSYDGSTTVPISAATTGASSGNYTFSYSGRHVPTQTNQVFSADVYKFTIALGANPYDPTNFSTTFDPMLVRWSDQDNAFEWVPEQTNQAGEQPLTNGSYLVCALDTRQEILVWSDAALYSMQYLKPPLVFGFNLLSDNISIASPNAAVTANNVTYWMGSDKFYTYSGRVETLPCTLRQYVFGNINREQMFQIVSGTNEGYSEVWWFYPSANSIVNDRYVVYNYMERVWYYGTLNRSAWHDSSLRSYPMAAFGVQRSYLNASLSSTATSITLLNGSTYPSSGTVTIDSEQITYTGISGNTLTGCTRAANGTTAATHSAYTPVSYNIPNQVMFHEYGMDDQSGAAPQPIAAYIASSDFDIGDGHNFGFVWRILPDLTFDGSTADNPKVSLILMPRRNSGAPYSTKLLPNELLLNDQSALLLNDGTSLLLNAESDQVAMQDVTRLAVYPVEQYTGQVYTRVRGRQMKFQLQSTDLGVTWQMGAMRIDIRPDGRR